METTFYTFELLSDSILLRHKKMFPKGIIFTSLFYAMLGAMFIVPSIIFWCYSGYFYAIMFFIFGMIPIVVIIYNAVIVKKRESTFLVEIKADGIHHHDIDGEYFMPWSDVKNYGFINKVSTGIRVCDPPFQTCLYCSTREHEGQKLRDELWSGFKNSYGHYSWFGMIVLEFHESEIDQSIMDTINSYITMYCDKEKENSFIINDPDYPY